MNKDLHNKINYKVGVSNYYYHVEKQEGIELAAGFACYNRLDITNRGVLRDQWKEWYHQMRESRKLLDEALDTQIPDDEIEYWTQQNQLNLKVNFTK